MISRWLLVMLGSLWFVTAGVGYLSVLMLTEESTPIWGIPLSLLALVLTVEMVVLTRLMIKVDKKWRSEKG